jgi:hypothetical protein
LGWSCRQHIQALCDDPNMTEPMTGPSRRGPGVVVALASVLTVLILIWVVGAVLLVHFADELPAPPAEPTSSAPRRIG